MYISTATESNVGNESTHCSLRQGRILLLSYAFPPMQVQMMPAVFKPMASLARLGYEVDVVTASSFCKELPLDDSLLPLAQSTFASVTRLDPPGGLRGRLQQRFNVLQRVPDLMAVLHQPTYEHLMDLDLTRYDAVMTWSPFHSVNAAMARVKKHRRNIRWIAQFSDPWAGNPLEINRLCKLWNIWHEPETVAAADWIVHSSPYSLELMFRGNRQGLRAKTGVLPHVFHSELYPARPKTSDAQIVMRYVGVLYGRRSPEPVFAALGNVFARRPELRGQLVVEIVGLVPPEMLQTAAAQALPQGTIRTVGTVGYMESLRLMHDADILLLIEADVRRNLFLASKVSDYIGAGAPIVGVVPPGASEETMRELGAWYAAPRDIAGIERALEGAIDHVLVGTGRPWWNESFRRTLSGEYVARQFSDIIRES
ncbi:glycosyltransferase family 4 protein [Ramlibacter sp. G-1-2-2]|uniref:Glycosyltransferase family 4 protein n=1 Tax=Ramlibacter agri TaxID=2728837 RepID=A0A848HGX0_9BURK|nr:hypothetical protein [Ramlibacter agri]NML47773.1 glycosyltransferase family 4 protein [Ramlibacter agri]